jgi:hypothetical protein
VAARRFVLSSPHEPCPRIDEPDGYRLMIAQREEAAG